MPSTVVRCTSSGQRAVFPCTDPFVAVRDIQFPFYKKSQLVGSIQGVEEVQRQIGRTSRVDLYLYLVRAVEQVE